MYDLPRKREFRSAELGQSDRFKKLKRRMGRSDKC